MFMWSSLTKWLGELVTPPAIVAPIASTDTNLPPKPGSSEQIYLTGAPGRPTSKQLVVAEYQARIHDKRNETVLKREAETLAAWLAENHPSAPRMRVGTIENAIRERHRSGEDCRRWSHVNIRSVSAWRVAGAQVRTADHHSYYAHGSPRSPR